MSKLPTDIVAAFPGLSPEAQASVLAKLERYVARGTWAAAELAALAALGDAASKTGPAQQAEAKPKGRA